MLTRFFKRLFYSQEEMDAKHVITETASSNTAWVTLATNDSYSLGALVLAHSLRKVNTVHQIAVLITPAVSPAMREQLSSVFDLVKIVDVLDSKDEANLALLKRPELGVTFTKLHCWALTQYEKGVFLDADTLVVRNSDELFDRDEFSAAPDVGWPDCFNSGVFVFKPSIATFNNLLQFAVEKGSFDGGDQGLLNEFFSSWATDDIRKHLPFVYNLTSVAVYSYIPAFKQYGSDTRIVHFIGPVKPWLQPVDPSSRTVTPASDSAHLQPLLQHWWDIFIEKVHPTLSANLDRASGMLLAIFAQLECSTTPLEPCLPPPAPAYPEPYTPYIEKDDARQYNLPYHPFQVVSTEGELLNFTFADFARELDSLPEVEDVQLPEEPPQDPEPIVASETEPPVSEPPEPEPVHEVHPEPENPFDYHRFVPDESCINAYLDQNIQQYQPYDHYQGPRDEQPLPRFLTIPEDDPRQGHVPYHREPSPERQSESQWKPWEMPEEMQENHTDSWQNHSSPTPEVPAITRSKSMSNLVVDATDATSFQGLTHWKSQPDVAPVETKKLPGLKPLKPKDRTPNKVEPAPKYTEFTEFFMNNQFRDPFAPPVDKVGFVERAILKRNKSQTGLFDVPQGALESVNPPTPVKSKTPSPRMPPEINEYVDLKHCKRQSGNVPKQADAEKVQVGKLANSRSPHRRGKRSTRKVVEEQKLPEPVNYDVESILQRLSTLSTGYAPIVPPAPKEPVGNDSLQYSAFHREKTPQPSDGDFTNFFVPQRVVPDVVVDTLIQSDSAKRKNSKKIAKKPVKRFGPLADVPPMSSLTASPFAAPVGQSLSESEGVVPEIVVCAATPLPDNVIQPDLNLTFVIENSEREKPTLDVPIGAKLPDAKAFNGVREITLQLQKLSVDDPEPTLNGKISVIDASPDFSATEVGKETSINVSSTNADSICARSPDNEPLVVNGSNNADRCPNETSSDSASSVTVEKCAGSVDSSVSVEKSVESVVAAASDQELKDSVVAAASVETLSESIVAAVLVETPAESAVGSASDESDKCAVSNGKSAEFIIGAASGEMPSEAVSGEVLNDKSASPECLVPNEMVETYVYVHEEKHAQTENEVTDLNGGQEYTKNGENESNLKINGGEKNVNNDDFNNVICPETVLCQNAINVPNANANLVPEDTIKQLNPIDAQEKSIEKNSDLFNDHIGLAQETSTPSRMSCNDILPSVSTAVSYATAAKKEGVFLSAKEPSTVYYLPDVPVQAPTVTNLKRSRKYMNGKTVDTPKSPMPSSPVKYLKRKAENPEFQVPSNRFELLPVEKIVEINSRKKKVKKVSKKFATPSSLEPISFPSSSQSESVVRATQEEIVYLPEPDDIPGIAGAIAQLSLDPSSASVDSSAAQTEYLRRQSWETGKMDYMGRDSFANIWSKISETLSQQSIPESPNSSAAPNQP